MNPRRTVFSGSGKGWTGWVLLALAAIPVVILAFFFFAVMLAVLAVAIAVGVAQLAWFRYRGRSVFTGHRPRPHDEANTFTVVVRDITDEARAAEEPERPGAPPGPPRPSDD